MLYVPRVIVLACVELDLLSWDCSTINKLKPLMLHWVLPQIPCVLNPFNPLIKETSYDIKVLCIIAWNTNHLLKFKSVTKVLKDMGESTENVMLLVCPHFCFGLQLLLQQLSCYHKKSHKQERLSKGLFILFTFGWIYSTHQHTQCSKLAISSKDKHLGSTAQFNTKSTLLWIVNLNVQTQSLRLFE